METGVINKLKKILRTIFKDKNNIMNPSKEINSTRTCCLCKIEKNKDCFYKTGGLCKECSSKRMPCPLCKIMLNRSSLRNHMKRPHKNQNNKSF